MDEQAPRRSFWSRRVKIAFAIAAVEALIVWLKQDFTTWTVVIIAIPVILFYLLAGRSLESKSGREASWILAMSQALAVVAVILFAIVEKLALVLAAVFAAIVLYLLLSDRPKRHAD
jgi:hypothetical protein